MANKAIEILEKAEHDLDVEIRMWKNQGRPEVAQRCKLERAQVRIAIRELCDSETSEREKANELLPHVSNRIYTVVDQDGDLINCWKNKEDAEKHAEDLKKEHGTFFEATEQPLF